MIQKFKKMPLILTVMLCLIGISGSHVNGQVLECFTEPFESVEVSSPIQGTLSKLHLTLGQHVSKNELVGEIDYSVLVESKRLAEAKANASSRLDAVQIEIEVEEKRLKKLQKLRESGNASKIEIENSQAKIDSLKKKREAAEEEQFINRIDVERIQAEIELRKIRSPISGTLVKAYRSEGEFVAASEPTIARIVNIDRLKAKFYVTPGQSRRLQKSKSCFVQICSSGAKVEAQIDFHSPITSAESGTVEIQVSFENANRIYRSGEAVKLLVNGGPETKSSDERRNEK